MTKSRVGLLLSIVLLAPMVAFADNNHPEFRGTQTGPNEWIYTLTFAPLVNYSIFPESREIINPTTITLTGLFGVFAAAGPTSTDFPGSLNTVNLDWSAAVLEGGTKVVYTHVGAGTGNFPDFRHAFGFTIHARGAANGTVSFATLGFSRDTSEPLRDGSFNLDITGSIDGPVNPTQGQTVASLAAPPFEPVQIPNLIPALKEECQFVKMALDRQPLGSYAAAGTLCVKLETPSESSDAGSEARTARDLYKILARMNLPPATAADRFAALEADASEKDGIERFYALVALAKVAFEAGNLGKATTYAQELLQMAPQFPKDWNYGNAIYYGHFVLGRVALQSGDKKEAASQLLAAGATPGSPQLDSFGPNVTLAKDLLAQGETQPVLEYLVECKTFWKRHRDRLDEWIAVIRAGGTPDFRSNLNY